MSAHYKAMLVVMFLTVLAFLIAKPVFTRFMSEQDFARRRNIWIAFTLAAFLFSNYLVFAVISACLFVYAAKKDSNPAALYLFLLLAIPPLNKAFGIPGVVNSLVGINHIRILALIVLVPVAMKLWSNRRPPMQQPVPAVWLLPDIFLVAYACLQLALQAPYASITVSMRLTFELVAFTLLPYYAISRSCDTPERLKELMAVFVLAMIVLVPLALFEWRFRWILFRGLETQWGGTGGRLLAPVWRAGILRAAGPAGHPIVLGFALTIALGMWFCLKEQIAARGWRWLGIVALISALVVTYSRGPWVGAVAMIFVFSMTGPGAGRRTAQAIGYCALIAIAVLVLPYGDKVISYLPFVGSVDSGSVVYRQMVAEASWNVIKMNPLFGNFNYMSNLEELRTGEGIIDIVNSYAAIALSYGLVGLSLFCGFFASLAVLCYRSIRMAGETSPQLVLIGQALLASLAACMVTIATVSQYMSVPAVEVSLGAMMAGYVLIVRRQREHASVSRSGTWADRFAAPASRTNLPISTRDVRRT